ncbi:hypothetical protein TNCV_664161 [Trichonephila clavipes]|nr:hypothetical protein TNCV_664161 [Trichonephila clavipes]
MTSTAVKQRYFNHIGQFLQGATLWIKEYFNSALGNVRRAIDDAPRNVEPRSRGKDDF